MGTAQSRADAGRTKMLRALPSSWMSSDPPGHENWGGRAAALRASPATSSALPSSRAAFWRSGAINRILKQTALASRSIFLF